jgi:uncharacterized membrane protein YcjF (UPF0283 family)
MSDFEAQEIKARIALRDLEEKTKLIKLIKRKGNLLMGIWFTLAIISWSIPYYLEINSADNSSAVGFPFSIISILLLFTLIVNVNHKLNSLVELLEIDKYPFKKEESSE